jgi:glycosyltransferase involved in cell wall biosynthesis
VTGAVTEAPGRDAGPSPAGAGRRLLLVINEIPFLVSHRLPIALAALRAGYEVHVAVPRASGDAEVLERLGLSVHDIPLDRRGMNPAAEARLVARLVALARALRPDVMHLVTVKPVLYGALAARITGVPCVVAAISGLGYLHLAQGWRARLVRGVTSALYRQAFAQRGLRALFQNADDRATFVEAGLVPARRAVHQRGGSGVDLARFVPRPEPPGPPVVMLPSRMLWDKGVGDFVEAARLLRARGVRARLVLVGDTDANRAAVPRQTLEAWAREGVVEWWGRRTDMPTTLAEAHVVVLPSYREGCPKVLLEAAACGRPMVTTHVPGCRDVVAPGEEGLLVPARDATALADAIEALVADPALRARMGARARARAEREFGVERVIAAHLALYAGAERGP